MQKMVDDLDGRTTATTTVRFALDGTEYDIDLNDRHAATLRTLLGKYAGRGRTVRPPVKRRRRTPNGTNGSGGQSAVRAWAKAQGLQVSERGRLSTDVIQRFQDRGADA